MPIYHDGKKMKPYRGYRKPVNVYYGDKKVAGWKNSTQTGNNLTFQTTYNDTADVVVKGKTLQKSEWVHKQGLTTQDSFAVNDEITVPYRGYNLTFRIVHINGELLTLEMKYVFGSSSTYKSIQFDEAEALYFAEDGLAAGTYNFTLLSGYDIDYGGGKTYQFTLAQDVPAGGCLMFPWGYQVQADTVKISSYASLTATTAIENVSVMEGASGTNLGTADGNTENMNHTHRIRYGSNNYAQSAIRQWLNSSAALGSVWAPQTKFDRPPSWHTSTDPAYEGFMRGFDSDFLEVIQPAIIPYRTNGVHEVNSLDGTVQEVNQVYTMTDKFFLLSRPEIYGTWDSTSYKDGEQLDYYKGLTDLERIKYDAFGTPHYAWLRSPYPSYADNVRYVRGDGSLNSYSADGSLGCAPACNVKISNLQTLIDNGTISYTHANPSPLYPQPLISNLPAGTYKTQDWKGDWYEFTLDEDLHGIDDAKDSVEFDKYSHRGWCRQYFNDVDLGSLAWTYTSGTFARMVAALTDVKLSPNVSTIANILCTQYAASSILGVYNHVADNIIGVHDTQPHIWVYSSTMGTSAAEFKVSVSGAKLVYQIATPTRTSLAFTKNNASTAPELPMEFLTDTPSLEYPAEVFDASGEVISKTPNLTHIDNMNVSFENAYFKDHFPQTPKVLLQPNTQYTLSFDYKINSATADVGCGIGYGGDIYRKDFAADITYPTQTSGRFVYTFLTPTSFDPTAGTPYLQLRLARTSVPASVDVDISNITFALGYYSGKARYAEPVTAQIPPLRKVGDVADEYDFKTGKITRKIGRIESYDGEDVGDDWISSTGALDTGATVEYVLAEPIEEQYTPVTLPTYYPQTIVTTTNDTVATLSTTVTVKTEE